MPSSLFEQNSTTQVWLCSFQQQEVVVKALNTHQMAQCEADVLTELNRLPNVARLLDIVEFQLPSDATPYSGLMFPYYNFQGDLPPLLSRSA
jgi:hypothetical protein